MSEKLNFWILVGGLFMVVGSWLLLGRAFAYYGSELLLRLLKPRCCHVWTTKMVYPAAVVQMEKCTISFGRAKCFCEKCKHGQLMDVGVQANHDGSGCVYFTERLKVVQRTTYKQLILNEEGNE